MTRLRTRLFRFSLIVLALAGLTRLASAQHIEAFEDTSRLVVIGGSLTEIVYALGEEDRIVARDSTATYPPAARELPDVGYMRALSPEGVMSVSPTALLVIEGSGPPEVLDVLKDSGVPYVTVPQGYSAQGILTKIEVVGQALGVTDKAAALADDVAAELAATANAVAGIEDPERVLFILSNRGGKINASGTGSAADGIIEMAGAENAISGYSGYKQLTEEAITAANPDVILMMDRGGDHGAPNTELLEHPAIALTPAGRNERIIRMDGSYLLGFGPRTAAAARDLAHALYGDAVTPAKSAGMAAAN